MIFRSVCLMNPVTFWTERPSVGWPLQFAIGLVPLYVGLSIKALIN